MTYRWKAYAKENRLSYCVVSALVQAEIGGGGVEISVVAAVLLFDL